ncbi:MAG: hypothetical protein LBM75_08670 [Myxococcales bacterium]|jgi:hypothetical protein|nr:hypothetical protein [Myxococcales bacterium]
MSLLPERASYFEIVQACFLAFRGDGMALSPKDAELVFEWHERQVPCEVVCQGIRAAAERSIIDTRVTSRPRSLRACRREIEREIARHLTVSVGQRRAPSINLGDSDESTYAHTRLNRARRTLDELTLTPSRLGFLESLLDASEDSDDLDVRLARFEQAVAIFTLRAQPVEVRREVIRRARAKTGARRLLTSWQAHREALRHHLIAEIGRCGFSSRLACDS